MLPDPVKEVGEVEIGVPVVSGWAFVSIGKKPKPPKKVSCGGPEPPCWCEDLPCGVKPLGIVTRVRWRDVKGVGAIEGVWSARGCQGRNLRKEELASHHSDSEETIKQTPSSWLFEGRWRGAMYSK